MSNSNETDDRSASTSDGTRSDGGLPPDGGPPPDGEPPSDGESTVSDESRSDDESHPDDDPLPADPTVGKGLLDAEMGPSSALAHLYRGEIHRMKLWRERLDKTTNWSVLVMAAILTWAFSSANNPHYVILVGAAAIVLFLVVESHRYRAYDVWRSRVRCLQENVWAYGLDPSQGLVDEDWRANLADDYRTPTVKITSEEAIAHRLRRVYLPLLTVLFGAWVIRVGAFDPVAWPASAAVGQISGLSVTGVVAGFYLAAIVVAYRPRTWHARDELRTVDLRKEQ